MTGKAFHTAEDSGRLLRQQPSEEGLAEDGAESAKRKKPAKWQMRPLMCVPDFLWLGWRPDLYVRMEGWKLN